VLTPEVRAGEALVFAQEIAEVRPRLGEGLYFFAVDGK
jgi:hypothetical protein